MFDSVRMRMTLWYVGVLSVILIAFSIAIYVFVQRSLLERVDSGLSSTLESVSASFEHAGATGENGQQVAKRVLRELHRPNQAIAIFDARGQLLAEQPGEGPVHVRLPESGISSLSSIRTYSLVEQNADSDDSCRGVVGRVSVPPDASYVVVVNQSLEPVYEQLDSLENILYVAMLLMLALAGGGGWFLARKSLQPVVAMSEHAQRISAENLDQRLPVVNPRDELGHLASTFNELLARLADSFSQQRQFMADASHELRTPLSVIRTASAVTLQQENREKDEYREALTIIEHQARRLSRIVEDMFLLARADADHPSLQITDFYLDELLTETARAAAVLAAKKCLQLEVPPFPETPFRGDEGLLRQMVWNLLDNAIKHTPRHGKIRIELERRDAEYAIRVHDAGRGIPPEVQPHIFERFYRGDNGVSVAEASDGGAGLGLPIARWIAEVHHGRLELQCSAATGSTFIVFLPRG